MSCYEGSLSLKASISGRLYPGLKHCLRSAQQPFQLSLLCIKTCDRGYCGRHKETGKPRGFAFLAYEDQRSTNLAVDNLNGMKVGGRMITVDHVDNYKRKRAEVRFLVWIMHQYALILISQLLPKLKITLDM